MTENLLHFWKQAGFILVQITPNKEASSGYPSAMMLYPITEQGKTFCEKAKTKFEHDQAVIFNQENTNFSFQAEDRQNLFGFANYHRTLTACYASLKRLYFPIPRNLRNLPRFYQALGMHIVNHKLSNGGKLFNKKYSMQTFNFTCKNTYLVL